MVLIRLTVDNATNPFFGLFTNDAKYDFYWLDDASNMYKETTKLPTKSRYKKLDFDADESYLARATAAHNSNAYRKLDSVMKARAMAQLNLKTFFGGVAGKSIAITTAKLWMGLILGNDRAKTYSHDVSVIKQVWGHKHGSVELTDDGTVTNTLMFGAVRSATVFIAKQHVKSTVTPEFHDWCLNWSVGAPSTCGKVEVGHVVYANEDDQTIRIRSMVGSGGLYNPYAAFGSIPGTMGTQKVSLSAVLGTTIHLASTYFGHEMAHQNPQIMKGLRRFFDDSPQICSPVAKRCYEQFVQRVNLSTLSTGDVTIKLVVADDTFILPCLLVNQAKTVGLMVATYPDGIYQIEYDDGDDHVVEYISYELKTRWSSPAMSDPFSITDVQTRDRKGGHFWASHLQALIQCVAAKFAHPENAVHYCIQVVAIPNTPQVDFIDISTSLIKDDHVKTVSGMTMEQVVYSHALSSPELRFYSDDVLHVSHTSAVMFVMLIAVHDSEIGYVCEVENNSNTYTKVFPWVTRFTIDQPARTRLKFYENDAVNEGFGYTYTDNTILYIPLEIDKGKAHYVGFNPNTRKHVQQTKPTTFKPQHATVDIGDCYAATDSDESQFAALALPAFVVKHNEKRSKKTSPLKLQKRKSYNTATFQDKFIDNEKQTAATIQPTPSKAKKRRAKPKT